VPEGHGVLMLGCLALLAGKDCCGLGYVDGG
jgi:hypothetical protein